MHVSWRRWKSAVVVTNPFHQFRAFRTFQCAAKQALPPQERPQVSAARRASNADRHLACPVWVLPQ